MSDESKSRVLIIDDNLDVREVLKTIVEHMGLIAVTAASGKEAMASITSEPPDVILLDLMMPEMSGFEVLYRLLTGDPRTRDIPVIVVSASGIDRQKMLKLPGISEVIVKASFSVADVERAVMNALNSPHG